MCVVMQKHDTYTREIMQARKFMNKQNREYKERAGQGKTRYFNKF